MTHTPGPWTESVQGTYIRYQGIHGPNICAMDVFGGPPEEGKANARLIAAAPELLEMLKRAIEELRLIRLKDCNAVYDVTLRIEAAQLLAKAEAPKE